MDTALKERIRINNMPFSFLDAEFLDPTKPHIKGFISDRTVQDSYV
jgi:hypothetical protein